MAYLRLPGYCLNQLLRDFLRIAVQNPDPPDILNTCKPLQKFRETLFSIQVNAVQCRLLRHKDQLPDSAFGKLPRLLHQLLHRYTPVLSPDFRNNAIGAVLAAAFGNLQAGIMSPCGYHPVPVRLRRCAKVAVMVPTAPCQGLLHGLRYLPDCHGSHQRVHLGNFFPDFLLIPLGQTAGSYQCFQPALLLQLRHFQQRLNAFFLGIPYETACVNHDNIRRPLVVRKGISFFLQKSQHHFRIHQILVTTQRHKHNIHNNVNSTSLEALLPTAANPASPVQCEKNVCFPFRRQVLSLVGSFPGMRK